MTHTAPELSISTVVIIISTYLVLLKWACFNYMAEECWSHPVTWLTRCLNSIISHHHPPRVTVCLSRWCFNEHSGKEEMKRSASPPITFKHNKSSASRDNSPHLMSAGIAQGSWKGKLLALSFWQSKANNLDPRLNATTVLGWKYSLFFCSFYMAAHTHISLTKINSVLWFLLSLW